MENNALNPRLTPMGGAGNRPKGADGTPCDQKYHRSKTSHPRKGGEALTHTKTLQIQQKCNNTTCMFELHRDKISAAISAEPPEGPITTIG